MAVCCEKCCTPVISQDKKSQCTLSEKIITTEIAPFIYGIALNFISCTGVNVLAFNTNILL